MSTENTTAGPSAKTSTPTRSARSGQHSATDAEPSVEPGVPWNGEFYVSYSNDRPWDDARKYGFISGGGGLWYSRTLKLLSPGDRIWVNVPGVGYVGVGIVVEERRPIREFTVATDQGTRPVLDVLSAGLKIREYPDDPDRAEYFVRVDWLDAVPKADAFREVGLFGNQNTVCKPTVPNWQRTIERLNTAFPNWNRTDSDKAKE